MRNWKFLTIVCVAALAAPAAWGGMRVRMTSHSDRANGFAGGAFMATSIGSDPLPDTGFATFCIETSEFISLPGEYHIKISEAADAGGSGGPSPDPIDARTAYLYQTYRTNAGALNAYLTNGASFTGTQSQRQAATRQLQEAIWYLENENLGVQNLLVSHAASMQTENGGTWSGLGNVRVMNMWANPDYTGNKQDQLILVPAPAAVALGALGLALVYRFTRKRVAA